MASVSASHLIIFVASLVIAAGVVGTLTTGVERVSSSIDDGSLDVSQQIRMDMSFVSDPGADYDSTTEIEIYVRNTGSQPVPIEESAVDVVFNGEFLGTGQFEINDANGNSNTWRPGDVVEIRITDTSSINDGDNRLFLSVNGDEELFEFRANP